MRPETTAEGIARQDAELARTGIIQCERQVFEIAREVLGRFSMRLDNGLGPFFRAGLTDLDELTTHDEKEQPMSETAAPTRTEDR